MSATGDDMFTSSDFLKQVKRPVTLFRTINEHSEVFAKLKFRKNFGSKVFDHKKRIQFYDTKDYAIALSYLETNEIEYVLSDKFRTLSVENEALIMIMLLVTTSNVGLIDA